MNYSLFRMSIILLKSVERERETMNNNKNMPAEWNHPKEILKEINQFQLQVSPSKKHVGSEIKQGK